MKKYTTAITCVILIMAVLGLAACRGDMTPQAPAADGSFDLPLTGGGFNWGRRDRTAVNESFALTVSDAYFFDVDEEAMPFPEEEPIVQQAAPGQVEWDEVAGTGQRHIIQTANVELETEYFDDAVAKLRGLPQSVNGYIEHEMLTNRGQRMLTIVLRVPVASFETVLRQVENLAGVRASNQFAEDVTEHFYDLVGSYDVRRIEEDRILALLDVAEEIHEILALEERLSNTRLSIEMYLSQLNNLAGRIAYSTITVTLWDMYEEEVEDDIVTLGARIGGAFGDSVDGTVNAVQNFIVFLAGVVLPLLIVGAFGFAVYKVVRVFTGKKMDA